MCTKYPLIYYLIIVFIVLAVSVIAQVCEKTEVATRIVTETFITTRWETYSGKCYPFCSKLITYEGQRKGPKVEVKRIKFCCSGYIRADDSTDNSAIVCNPICMPACKNGSCTSPGKCVCNTGYVPDPESKHNCLPHCGNDCNNGVCIAPNTCRCNFGYSFVNGTCQPVCTEFCPNGTCVAPEQCECFPGYRKSADNNLCEPYCSNGCDNGVCTAPDTCTCNTGWHEAPSENLLNKVCKPFCSKPCENGTCVAPETCECLPGYKQSGDICEPECNSGWKFEDGECIPVCKYPCGTFNGKCVAPNECHCFNGYHIDIRALLVGFVDGPLCIPTCNDCRGTCVAPNRCILTSTSAITMTTESIVSNSTKTQESITYDDYTNYSNYDSYDVSYPDYVDFGSPNASDNDTIDIIKYLDEDDKEEPSWIQQHWEAIIIPLVILVTAGLMILLIWRWKPIIEYFKGRSYIVEGGPPDNGAYPFEDIQISPITDKEIKEAPK